MKLVEILARELERWPEGSHCACQDNDGKTFLWTGEPDRAGDWIDNKGAEIHGRLGDFTLASDHYTAIITRADWEAERARIKGETKVKQQGWIRRKSKGMPQNANGMIEVVCRDGMKEIDYADNFAWSTNPRHSSHIVKWRPHKAEHEPKAGRLVTEDAVLDFGFTGEGEAQMPAAKYFDGPYAWRDRIHAIDFDKAAAQKAHEAAMAALDSERAELVAKLKAEGLALIQAEEDMSDWRNWRAGDSVMCVSVPLSHRGYYQVGEVYVVGCVDADDQGGSGEVDIYCDSGFTLWNAASDFRWHSR